MVKGCPSPGGHLTAWGLVMTHCFHCSEEKCLEMSPYYCCLVVFSDDICGDGGFLFCSAGVGEEDAEYSAWAPWKEVK